MLTPLELDLDWLPSRYAVCRLPAHGPWPAWIAAALEADPPLLSVTRTHDELSILAPEELVPIESDAPTVQRGLVAIAVRGPLDFSLVGVLARLSAALADANVPVLAVSTHDTDILLVPARCGDDAHAALAAMATVHGRPPE